MNQLPYILLKRVSQTTRQPETGWDPASQIETLQELLMEYQNRVAVVKTVIKKAKVLGQWSLAISQFPNVNTRLFFGGTDRESNCPEIVGTRRIHKRTLKNHPQRVSIVSIIHWGPRSTFAPGIIHFTIGLTTPPGCRKENIFTFCDISIEFISSV